MTVTTLMAAGEMDDLEHAFDDHPSLSASLEDFEEEPHTSPTLDLPSQHSGFRSEPDDSDLDEKSSNSGPWSPPGLRRHYRGGSRGAELWFRHDPYGTAGCLELRPSMSPSRSRQTSPEYEDATEGEEDITLAANVPLPTGTDSPLKERSPDPEAAAERIGSTLAEETQIAVVPKHYNYIRFALRAEVQHREPFLAVSKFLQGKLDAMTRTKTSTIMTIVSSLFLISIMRLLFIPPTPPPVPDMVKLSTLAKSFEPVIFYSENGYLQITALQETSVAVWDLGESVRSANMTSAPMIVQSLDELSESLKTLGLELNRFFADVDSDVDSILLVMDWAKRELTGLTSPRSQAVSSQIMDHVHNLLNRGNLLESPNGDATIIGGVMNQLLGSSSPQRARRTLTRTFHEFINVLEESINSELTHSTALFALFESIDRQFLNLQRVVVRESDTQERLASDLLSGLWARLVGPNASSVRKYERNRHLLAEVRARTVSNKHLLLQHHGRLQTLKVNLETLRRRLVSPLMRRKDDNSIGSLTGYAGGHDSLALVQDQIRGLDGTYRYLRSVRDRQKTKLLEMIYGAGAGAKKTTTTLVAATEAAGADGDGDGDGIEQGKKMIGGSGTR